MGLRREKLGEAWIVIVLFLAIIVAITLAGVAFSKASHSSVDARATLSVSSAAITTTPTSLLVGTINGTFTLGANALSQSSVIRFKAGMSAIGVPGQVLILNFGTTGVPTLMSLNVPINAEDEIVFEADIVLKGSTSVSGNCSAMTNNGTFLTSNRGFTSNQFDPTVPNTIDFQAAWVTEDPSVQLIVNVASLETLDYNKKNSN